MVVPRLPLASAFDYLAAIGWPGELCRLRRELAVVADRVESVALAFGLGPEPLPGLGFECYLPGTDRAAWEDLLAVLVRRGLSTPEKPAALLEWPGTSDGFHRSLTHVKLVWHPQRGVEAKAYFDIQEPVIPLAAAGAAMNDERLIGS